MNAPRDLPEVLRQAQRISAAADDAAAAGAAAAGDGASPFSKPPGLFTRQRVLVAVVAGLVLFGLFYPVENVVVASGQVIPSDRVQSVQHLEGGIVTAVHVREGQTIGKGDPILDIDLGGASLNLEQLTARSATAQAVRTRLTAESQGQQLEADQFPAEVDARIVRSELGAFSARALEHRGALASSEAQLAQARGDVAQTRARIQGLESSLRLYEQEAQIANQLAAEQLIGQLEVIDKQRALEAVRTDLAAARQSLVSNQAKVEQAQAKLMETRGAFRRRASEELAQTERELMSLSEDLSRAQSQRTRTVVVAPTDGIVKGLRSSGAGWVVKPGEPILEIVPDKDEVVVEARLNPSDRGYVHVGQATKAKITAYDYLRYGFVQGRVRLVSADADRDPNRPDAPSYFRIQASLEQPWVGRTENRITTGMQAELDLLVGHEPFIWYLLRPVLHIQSEAFREP
ncbi:HlyD family type I secretion periplasmic adaptor subunit [Comamonas endophytica]|uniref:Membrane fusion protein (MFP) family protein n=1 Tax=Comamonas endophytica TaxID=2949090 RepID=A0ABY6GBK5_9BURK|nr:MULTISPECIES: HlyD family type I secretion periplasmic adaptor subunit [unclassified Acidovorax]MCD2512144.1 HlyD family type I secretion periplasmic adaptor subunit [Acidovorax sp. D4N7]UYG51917.1 HlyD family type I secretion periplasmic adaptor subunit [Acidovorax sp. 5MLIR]